MTPAVIASADRLATLLGLTRRQVWSRVRADFRISSVHGKAVEPAVEMWLLSAISEIEAEQRAYREYSQHIQGLVESLCDDDPIAPVTLISSSSEAAS